MAADQQVVLVVDDQEIIRGLLERLLHTSGYHVLTASSGAKALALLRMHHVDLILLDMMMPGLSGTEVLQKLKASPETNTIPVIVVSADSNVDSIVGCLKLGAEDYLVKPFNAVILEARVGACLERQRLRTQEQRYRLELEARVAERTAELAHSEERYALAARGANDGLWDWDIRAGQIYFSPRWKEMLGYSEQEIDTIPDEWFERVHPEDRDRLETRIMAHFQRLLSHFEHEYRIQHKDGSYRWMLCRGLAVWDEQGHAARMAGSQTDITDRKLVEQQLLHDAFHDGLTGLPNRALFLDRLSHAMARAQRHPDYSFAVLFLDLDRFKVINDSLGHLVGDQLLISIARRLEDRLRAADTVARLGGDEFTILLEDMQDSQAALDIAENIQRAISTPLRLSGQDVFTTASIGIVIINPAYESAADIIRDADTAMYQAKLTGKARSVVFDPSMHALAMSQLQLESDLRRAIEREELTVHYQPIVSLSNRKIVGLEALVRWQHPQRGLLLPGEFLPIAEETGLIVPMGWWVLRETCRQMRAWQDDNPDIQALWVNVNLSEKQLSQPDVVEHIFRILRETRLDARMLKLEITESTLLAYGEMTSRVFTQIREAGVQLCIDDFGTGYSSLSYLQRFPVDVLKIDRSFINQLGNNGERGEIVQTILTLARALNLQAVAEGTETIQQVDRLKELKCDLGQGWLFSKALDAASIGLLLRAESPFPELTVDK